jgi:hypothetical protein
VRPERTASLLLESPDTVETIIDPKDAAESAGLRYVSDARPGIRRKKAGTGFGYIRADGSKLTEKDVLKRIKALAIPPAWTEVWICPFSDGHIQATGRDAKARKQYRYHARFREVRESTKYEHSRERYFMVEPMGNGLRGVTLRFAQEVRSADDYFDEIPEIELSAEMVKLAQHINSIRQC